MEGLRPRLRVLGVLVLGGALIGGYPLRLQYDALELFKNRELLVGVVNFGVALALGNQEADFFQPFKLALDITGVFFDKFG
jgi:hypothetical protein